jgi:hypothetical protein
MNRYRIRGRYKDHYTCDCSYCEGHDVTSSVSEEVMASSEGDAIKAIEKKYLPLEFDEFEWVGIPDVREVSETELMARLPREVAPTLPGFQDAISSFYS